MNSPVPSCLPARVRVRSYPSLCYSLLTFLCLVLLPVRARAAEGDLQWAQQLYSGAGIGFTTMTVDPAGNVVMAGRLYQNGAFQPGGAALAVEDTLQYQDLFLAKLLPSGALLWLKTMPGFTRQTAKSLAVDNAGDIVVTGTYKGTADLDPGPGTALLNSGGADAAYAAKYASDGTFQWAQSWTVTTVYASVDVDKNVFLCGHYTKATLYPGGPELQATGAHDAFAMKLNAAGEHLWSHVLASANDDLANGITTDAQGNVYLLGTAGPGEFLLGDTVLRQEAALTSAFVIKLDAEGSPVWDSYLPGDLNVIAVDAAQEVYIAGGYSRAIEIAGNVYTPQGIGPEGMALKLNSFGNLAWFKNIASDQKVAGMRISLSTDGRVLVAGDYSGALSFGDPLHDLPAAAGIDVFVAAFDAAGTLHYTRRIAGDYEVYLYGLNASGTDATYLTGISIIPNGSPALPANVDADPGQGVLQLNGWGGYLIKLDGTGVAPAPIHSVDIDGDSRVSISELLRLVQFYNFDGFHCDDGGGQSEDGYLPGAAGSENCAPHAADYNPQDWHINISEVLRIVQFYNVGGYHVCPDAGSEDGYCVE